MKVMVLGADGYLGWPTCLRLSNLGHDVIAVDNYEKRYLMEDMDVAPLLIANPLIKRVRAWGKNNIAVLEKDVVSSTFTDIIREHVPDAIVHYAEQPSAPYSMSDRYSCITTQTGNIISTLNILWAIKNTNIHLIKLGTMGEYGTPGVGIEEGWLSKDNFPELRDEDVDFKLPFPKLPGSFYHASKVADSVNIEFACRAWNIRATDLNQGIVYGIGTEETRSAPGLDTAFYYDSIFGTALNRFVAQSVVKNPITVYGNGGQKRSWLHIEDTMKCIQLALENPAKLGEFKVRNQFTEIFTVKQLAENVCHVLGGEIKNTPNPRVEQEGHFYEASNRSFLDLGLDPYHLSNDILLEMYDYVHRHRHSIIKDHLNIRIDWR